MATNPAGFQSSKVTQRLVQKSSVSFSLVLTPSIANPPKRITTRNFILVLASPDLAILRAVSVERGFDFRSVVHLGLDYSKACNLPSFTISTFGSYIASPLASKEKWSQNGVEVANIR